VGFLQNAIADANPFRELFLFSAEFAAITDPMVVCGQILVGSALPFGVPFRLAALMGAGRIIGVERALKETDVVRNAPWLRFLLG
jgi:thiosulfate dehydrogenase [quinone] large subunit